MPKLTIDIEGKLASFQDSLNHLEREASGIGRRIEASLGGLKRVGATIGAAVAGVGFTNLVRSSINVADALNDLSERTGVSVEKLSAFQYAARLSDLSAEGLETGLRALAKNMASGSDAFATLGVRVRQASGVLRSSDEVLLDLADAFQKLPDGATKSALAMQTFGKNGAELIPLLNGGRAGIAAFTREAEQLGVVVSSSTAKAAAEFNDNLDRISSAIKGTTNAFAEQLLPGLVQVSDRMVEAAKRGSVLEGVLRGLGEAGKITLFGVDPSAIEKQRKFVADVKKEVADLEARVQYTDKAGIIGRLSIGDPDELKRRLAGARITLKSAQESLANLLATPAAATPGGKIDIALADDSAAGGRARALAKAQQELEASVREVGRITADEAKNRAEIAEAYNRVELDQQEKTARERIRLATETQQQISALLDQTVGGQIKKIQESQAVMRSALQAGIIDTEQFGEALALLDEKASGVLFSASDKMKVLSNDGTEALDRLRSAIEGWGRRSADVFAELAVTGKASFSDLVQSILKDLVALAAYETVTKPLFAGIMGMFGGGGRGGGASWLGLAKGGVMAGGNLVPFAAGGIVNGPTVFPFANGVGLMGEAGPEAIMPLKRGPGGRLGVEASGGGGGLNITQVMTFNGGADPATMAAWAQGIKADTINTIQNMKRRGQG
jgi:lambda family phage tail tape measure protein